MKKLLFVLSPLFLLWGCVAFDEMDVISETNSLPAFSIEEAKEIFEMQYSKTVAEISTENTSFESELSPGEFTPLWKKSKYSAASGKSGYDVPLITSRKLHAVRVSYYGNEAKAYKVDMLQRLLVMKDKESGAGYCYIQTMIPDKSSSTGKVTSNDFVTFGQHNDNFSGLVIYTIPGSDKVIRVSKYNDGLKVDGVFLPGDNSSYNYRKNKASDMLSNLRIVATAAVVTRFGEYDDYYDDYYDDTYYGGELPPAIIVDEYPDDPNIPDPEFGYDSGSIEVNPPDPNEETSNLEGDNPTPPEEVVDEDDEYDKRIGIDALAKVKSDLKKGNVQIWQRINGALTGLSVGTSANGIILSASNFVKDFADDKALIAFGKRVGALGVAISSTQTIIAISNGENLSASDWLNILSNAFGAVALIPSPWSAPAGITSGILGLISVLVSEQLSPGWYELPTPNGGFVYVYIGNNIIIS